MNSRLPNQITVEHGIGKVRVAIWKKKWEIGEKHAGPLPGAPTVSAFPPGGHTN